MEPPSVLDGGSISSDTTMNLGWNYLGDVERENPYYVCAYCGAGVRSNNDPNALLFLKDTDWAWKREVRFHAPGCRWVASRGREPLIVPRSSVVA